MINDRMTAIFDFSQEIAVDVQKGCVQKSVDPDFTTSFSA